MVLLKSGANFLKNSADVYLTSAGTPAPTDFLQIVRNVWDASGNNIALIGSNTLYQSTDGGQTYSLLYTFPDNPGRMYGLFIDSNGYIFVAASGQVTGKDGRTYRSTDGGSTFSQISTFGGETISWWPMVEDASGNLYCGQYLGDNQSPKVWKSTDSGANWLDISDAGWASGGAVHIHGLGIDAVSGWLYVNIGDALAGMYRSKLLDGTDWVKKSNLKAIPIFAYNGVVCAGDDDGLGTIQEYTDDGGSGIPARTTRLVTGQQHNCYYIAKDYGGRLWASFPPTDAVGGACTGYIFTSSDWTNWFEVDSTPGIAYSSWYNAADEKSSLWTFQTGTTQWLSAGPVIFPLNSVSSVFVKATRPDIDTAIYAGQPDTNYGTGVAHSVGNISGNKVRMLLKGDATGLLDGTIREAFVRLYVTNVSADTAKTVGIHRAITEWFEGTSTWNYRNTTGPVAWAGGAGGGGGSDYAATAIGTASVGSAYAFVNFDVVTDVQDFIDAVATNYGWWLINTDEATSGSYKQFGASDNATAINRPLMIVSLSKGLT